MPAENTAARGLLPLTVPCRLGGKARLCTGQRCDLGDGTDARDKPGHDGTGSGYGRVARRHPGQHAPADTPWPTPPTAAAAQNGRTITMIKINASSRVGTSLAMR